MVESGYQYFLKASKVILRRIKLEDHWSNTRYCRISTVVEGWNVIGVQRMECVPPGGKISEVFLGKGTFALVPKDEYDLAGKMGRRSQRR